MIYSAFGVAPPWDRQTPSETTVRAQRFRDAIAWLVERHPHETQAQIAARLGVSHAHVNRYLKGRHPV